MCLENENAGEYDDTAHDETKSKHVYDSNAEYTSKMQLRRRGIAVKCRMLSRLRGGMHATRWGSYVARVLFLAAKKATV